MSTILITGANGLLGQFLIKDLLERGFAVVATGKGVNRLPFSEGEKFRYIEMDFTSGEQVRAVLQAVQPAVIVHAGAMTQVDPCELHPEDCYRTNVQGTEILLEGASLVKSRFIFVSTDFIFDGIGGPYREDDTPGPLSVYAANGRQRPLFGQAALNGPLPGRCWSMGHPSQAPVVISLHG